MPRTLEIERLDTGISAKAIQLVDPEIRVDLEPTAEVIGTMSEKMRGKWRGVEQIFRF